MQSTASPQECTASMLTVFIPQAQPEPSCCNAACGPYLKLPTSNLAKQTAGRQMPQHHTTTIKVCVLLWCTSQPSFHQGTQHCSNSANTAGNACRQCCYSAGTTQPTCTQVCFRLAACTNSADLFPADDDKPMCFAASRNPPTAFNSHVHCHAPSGACTIHRHFSSHNSAANTPTVILVSSSNSAASRTAAARAQYHVTSLRWVGCVPTQCRIASW
jgi:hypothetical protein